MLFCRPRVKLIRGILFGKIAENEKAGIFQKKIAAVAIAPNPD